MPQGTRNRRNPRNEEGRNGAIKLGAWEAGRQKHHHENTPMEYRTQTAPVESKSNCIPQGKHSMGQAQARYSPPASLEARPVKYDLRCRT
jgi:hypothetical protein